MPGKRRVVVHRGAERSIKEIERLAMIERRSIEWVPFVGETFGRVDVDAATRTERHRGGLRARRRDFSSGEVSYHKVAFQDELLKTERGGLAEEAAAPCGSYAVMHAKLFMSGSRHDAEWT